MYRYTHKLSRSQSIGERISTCISITLSIKLDRRAGETHKYKHTYSYRYRYKCRYPYQLSKTKSIGIGISISKSMMLKSLCR